MEAIYVDMHDMHIVSFSPHFEGHSTIMFWFWGYWKRHLLYLPAEYFAYVSPSVRRKKSGTQVSCYRVCMHLTVCYLNLRLDCLMGMTVVGNGSSRQQFLCHSSSALSARRAPLLMSESLSLSPTPDNAPFRHRWIEMALLPLSHHLQHAESGPRNCSAMLARYVCQIHQFSWLLENCSFQFLPLCLTTN